jgi:hypothetical protein
MSVRLLVGVPYRGLKKKLKVGDPCWSECALESQVSLFTRL